MQAVSTWQWMLDGSGWMVEVNAGTAISLLLGSVDIALDWENVNVESSSRGPCLIGS